MEHGHVPPAPSPSPSWDTALRSQHCPGGANTFAHRFHAVSFTRAVSQRLVNNEDALLQALPGFQVQSHQRPQDHPRRAGRKQTSSARSSVLRTVSPASAWHTPRSASLRATPSKTAATASLLPSGLCPASATCRHCEALRRQSGQRQAPAFQGVADEQQGAQS